MRVCVFAAQKLKPDADSDTKEKLQEGKPSSEAPVPAAAPTPAPGSVQGPGLAAYSSQTKVTNSSDLTDTREINFEYLKHVVLKFMSSREAEVRRDGLVVFNTTA